MAGLARFAAMLDHMQGVVELERTRRRVPGRKRRTGSWSARETTWTLGRGRRIGFFLHRRRRAGDMTIVAVRK